MSWIAPTPEVPDGPTVGADRVLLTSYLNFQRQTLLNICAGLSAEQLAMRPSPTTNLSLLGLIRHAAKFERIWFQIRAAGTGVEPLFDPSLGVDYDFEHIDPADAPAAIDTLLDERRIGDEAVAALSLDAVVPTRHGDWSLRMTYLHVIGEYARHNGHADLLRQAIDGVTAR